MNTHFSKLLIAAIGFLFIFSCTNDTPSQSIWVAPTCSDGIQNGNETGVDCGWACSNSCFTENGLEGTIVSTVILDSSVEYKLTGPLVIRDSGELIIRRGTVIKALPGVNAYIAVAIGGKLFVYGQEDEPVVITSDAENPAPGDWGGIVICGKASTHMGENARSELGDIFYGGNEPEDTSGVLKYLRVEYTGAYFNENVQFNGISFFGVGSFTTVEHVQSMEGLGDGFKFYGGTVNSTWLVSSNNLGNAITLTDGYQGIGEYWYLTNTSKAGVQLLNNLIDPLLEPTTIVNISNVSIVGPALEGAVTYTNGGGTGIIDQLYTNEIHLGINVIGPEATARIDAGEFTIPNIQFDNVLPDFSFTNYTGGTSFYTEGTTSGAGNGKEVPDWAAAWTRF